MFACAPGLTAVTSRAGLRAACNGTEEPTMTETGGIAANLRAVGDDGAPLRRGAEWGSAAAFLAAGSVLFASLVIGSSASLFLAGSNQLIAAILEGFLAFGLWTFGGFLAAVVAALAIAALRRHTPGP
jgi:hypothetical protein